MKRFWILLGELALYGAGLAIIFYQSWQFGIASVLMIFADTLKTIRMNGRIEDNIIDRTRTKIFGK